MLVLCQGAPTGQARSSPQAYDSTLNLNIYFHEIPIWTRTRDTLQFRVSLVHNCYSELRTGESTPGLAEVGLEDAEVYDVDYIVVVEVRR